MAQGGNAMVMNKTALMEKLQALDPQQRQALLARLAAQKQGADKNTAIEAAEGTADAGGLRALDAPNAPLSFAQSRLWLLDQIEGRHYKYNMVSAYALRGELDCAALQQALALIVQRHRILRTRFVATADDDTIGMQEPIADFHFELPLIDLSELPTSQREERLETLLLQEGRWLFDLAQGPLARFHLYRMDSDHHVLQMNLHHAVFDGWSKGVLFRELSLAYGDLRAGRSPDMPQLPVQFSDYAAWQRSALDTRMTAQADYWREALRDAPPLLELPTDFPRPAQQSSVGEILPVRVDAALTQALRELGQRHGATLFMTMLAAFKLLLYRYSGMRDIVLGTPVDMRNRSELRRLIGFFLNTVALRTRLDPSMDFPALLGTVKQACLSAFQHQDLPFEQVVEAVEPVRSQSFTPLFQSMFVFQHASAGAPELAGLESEKIAMGNLTTKYDLYLTLVERDQGLHGWLTFRSDLFRPATMQSLLTNFEELLRQIVAAPQSQLDDFPLLAAAEHAAALDAARGRRVPLVATPVHQVFAERAAARPDAVAVVDAAGETSYGQLQAAAERLSAVLAGQGVTAGDRVGVHLQRGHAYCQTLLAIWRRGAVAVPLDTRQPAARLGEIVTSAGLALLLHDQTQAPEFAASVACLQLADAMAAESPRPVATTMLVTECDWPAYVLFTSGSTGRPKGVVGSHRALANRLQWQWRDYPYAQGERSAQRANIGFIDSLTEIFSALLADVPVVVIDDASARDPYDLVDALAESAAGTLFIVPALFRAVLEAFPELDQRLPDLRRVFFSGEALTPDLVARFSEALPRTAMINAYGATEVAEASTIDVAGMSECARIPIGRPMDNMNLYVLDEQLRLCPTGVVGMLYAHGVSLAEGYWRNPALTAERFLPDPHADEPGARMYSLGDLGRRLADGTVEFIGRRDHQLNLRGFRIESSDIERVIERAPGILAAAVVAVPNSVGDEVLVGYACAEEDARVDLDTLKDYLRQRLPDYMQPGILVLCDELPSNVTGKIDHKALRARGLPELKDEFQAPRTPLEHRLAAIWCEILHLPRVSVLANFFDLGGHSLLGVRIAARIREECAVQLSVQELFQRLTIAGVAERVDALQRIQNLRDTGNAAEADTGAIEVSEF